MKRYIREKLKMLIRNDSFCRIQRENIDENPLYGFPLKITKELLLIEYIYDFQSDGFMFIKTDDITEVHYGESERFVETILYNENLRNPFKFDELKSISNMKDIFEYISSISCNVIVEDENQSKFLIGKIINCYDTSVEILCFDGTGKWDDVGVIIAYNEITSLTLDNRYINIMSKYIN